MLFCKGFGFRFDFGVSDIRQTPRFEDQFVDLTCSASGLQCVGFEQTAGTGLCERSLTCCANTQCCIETFSCECKASVINKIMKQFCIVADTLGLNIEEFHDTRIEDLILTFFWRRIYEINKRRETYPKFLITPIVKLEAVVPTSKPRNYAKVFSLPNGNNGHGGIGMTTGVNCDFYDTVGYGS